MNNDSHLLPPEQPLPPSSDPDPDFGSADWRTRSEREMDERLGRQEQR
jgi:hypothetical protein